MPRSPSAPPLLRLHAATVAAVLVTVVVAAAGGIALRLLELPGFRVEGYDVDRF